METACWCMMDDIENAKKFFADNPDIEILEAFVIDANGVPRGKWIPRERAIDVLE
jgi:glutamine synthetase